MTQLRKMMLDELQRRNYAENTIRHYLRVVEDFARRFCCSPDRLGPRHVREYQAELFQKRKLSANSVGQHLAALRFFYIKTLRRAWSLADTPYPKKIRSLPTILSREEVAQLLHAARTPGERILLMALYATGARNSELTHLKVSNIDSQRMVVHMSQLWRTHEDHRKAHGCRDPTALSSRVNRGCMKPLSPTRKLCVPRRAPHSSTSPPHLFPLKPLQRPSSPRFSGPRQLRPWQCEGPCSAAQPRHTLIPAFSPIEIA